LQINFQKPIFTETVKRFTLWNVGIFLLILAAFNIFIILITHLVFNESLDLRLKHEAENIIKSFELVSDSVIIINRMEFEESDLNEIRQHSFFLQVYDASGKILLKSNNINLLGNLPINPAKNFDSFNFDDVEVNGISLRSAYISLMDKYNEKTVFLQLATFKEEYASILNRIILFNLFSLPLIILIVVIASFFLAKNSTHPLNKIIETAKNISASNLSLRIEHTASHIDELGKLRDTLNSLFERLEKHINQISQFTDHASHQLMNPLTAIKTELEFILKKERTPEQYNETLRAMQEQTDRMINIIKSLLIIAREDRAMADNKNLFNASKAIEEVVTKLNKDSNFPAGQAGIQLDIQQDVYLKGDFEIFEMAVGNLIDNAVKFSNGDLVNVHFKARNNSAVLTVIDRGIGINDKEKKLVFEKFYRSEKAEHLGVKGYGLGLSIVKSVIAQLGGTIKVEDNLPKGTKFKIALPIENIE
jgi:signal transduction histidine kinase